MAILIFSPLSCCVHTEHSKPGVYINTKHVKMYNNKTKSLIDTIASNNGYR